MAVAVFCVNNQYKYDKLGPRIAFFCRHNVAKTVWRPGSARTRCGSFQRSPRLRSWILEAASRQKKGRVRRVGKKKGREEGRRGEARKKGRDRRKEGRAPVALWCLPSGSLPSVAGLSRLLLHASGTPCQRRLRQLSR